MMNANRKCAAALFAAAVSAAVLAGPLEDLVPEPRKVTALEGTASAKALGNVTFVRDTVAGAPDAVAEEAYVLEVTAEGVKMTASSQIGEMNAKKTLEQLVKLGQGTVPCCRIVDWPALRWRGCMLDTARNFLDVPSLKDLIDVMAAYKLNLFHWHFTENYAWRLQSKRFPEVEKKGYHDPMGSRHHGVFYTQADFKEVVDYAWKKGVTVMPEFDIPGHSAAFRKAFGFKSMRDRGVTDKLVALVRELCALAPKQKMPFVHLGGDEVWDPEERFNPGDMTTVAKAISDCGRTVVTWDPGERFDAKGPRVAMLWGGTQPADCPWFDARGWYIEDYDPFEVLGAASYLAPFKGEKRPQQLGALFCGWHDAAAGLPYTRLFTNQPVFPCCVAFGDLYWHGREYAPSFGRARLPLANDPMLSVAADLERRIIAQRDRVLTDLKQPFHFVRQTQMRWRLTDEDGTLIAKDIAQGSVFPQYGPDRLQNFTKKRTGTVHLETWIRSPDDRTVGVWIGMASPDRDQGRSRTGGTPEQGQWNRFGATVAVNGELIPPPVWEQPGLKPGGDVPEVKYQHEIDEIPFSNDEWYMREPTRVKLRKGWNHVKLTLPMTRPVDTWMTHRWVGTFMPVAGTTDHPREIEDLEYSSDPQ